MSTERELRIALKQFNREEPEDSCGTC